MPPTSGLMQGKRGVILGVANNRAIAWGIAKACREAGAVTGEVHHAGHHVVSITRPDAPDISLSKE